MQNKNVNDVLRGSCIYDLYRVPEDSKIWRIYHVYGDYEIPLNLFIDSNNMVIGVNSDLDRFYVGKVGEKCMLGREKVLPINLYFVDLHDGEDYLGNDVCHQGGLQNYWGYVFFNGKGNKAYLWGAYGDNYQEPCLPYSDGSLFSEIKGLNSDYINKSLSSFVYGMFYEASAKVPAILPLVQTIRKLTAESSLQYSEDFFNTECNNYSELYDLGGHVFCKRKDNSPAYHGLFPLV